MQNTKKLTLIEAGNGLIPAVRNFVSQSSVEGQARECHSTQTKFKNYLFSTTIYRGKNQPFVLRPDAGIKNILYTQRYINYMSYLFLLLKLTLTAYVL